MKRHLARVVISSLLVACSPPSEYLDAVLEFQNHKNDGDLESVMDLFADEPSLDFGPLGTIKGLAAVRGILEYDLTLNTHLQLQNCQVKELEVSCRVVESNDWLKTAGIESITYDENRFVFAADGRIGSVSARLSAESEQSIGKAVGEFHQWAITNQPAEYARLFSDAGAFVYNRENANRVLVLLRMWRSEE
jgi:hypothetical protein